MCWCNACQLNMWDTLLLSCESSSSWFKLRLFIGKIFQNAKQFSRIWLLRQMKLTGDGNRMRAFNESEKNRKTVKGSSSWVIIINNKFAWLLPHVNHADSFFMVFYMSGYQVLNCYWNNLIPNHTGAQCRGTLAWSNGWLCCENPHVCHSCYC